MAESWTVRRMLAWMVDDFRGVGIESARLDAELLLARVLGGDRVRLYMDMDRPLDAGELGALRAFIKRRRRHEPVAYILGEKEFYQRMLEVDSAVLVPRPETELVVDRALELLGADAAGPALDLCTGSGAIAISLAGERTGLVVDAVELSETALAVAQRNVTRHALDARLTLFCGDLFAPLPAGRRYTLIVSNPPYVAEPDWAALDATVREHEPRLALVAGHDGLEVIRRIATEAPAWLVPGGKLLLEIGAGQAAAVEALLHSLGYGGVRSHLDLAGIPRVVEASAGAPA
jgi:release factor glutamine methyltransferase